MPASPVDSTPDVTGSLNIPPDLPPNSQKWNREHVKLFFEANQEEYGLEDEDIELIYKNKVRGRHFRKLTEEKLSTHPYNLSGGAAATVIDLISLLIKLPQSVSVVTPHLEKDENLKRKVDSILETQGQILDTQGEIEENVRAANNNSFLNYTFGEGGSKYVLKGTTDVVILQNAYVRSSNLLGGMQVVVELKKQVGDQDTRQATLELISANVFSNYGVMVLLTDLNEHWHFLWLTKETRIEEIVLGLHCSVALLEDILHGRGSEEKPYSTRCNMEDIAAATTTTESKVDPFDCVPKPEVGNMEDFFNEMSEFEVKKWKLKHFVVRCYFGGHVMGTGQRTDRSNIYEGLSGYEDEDEAPVVAPPTTKKQAAPCPAAKAGKSRPAKISPQKTPPNDKLVKAVVIYGVPCQRPIADIIQDMGVRGIMGARWLLGGNWRLGKATSSVVVFFDRKLAVGSHLKMRGRWLPMEAYDFNRGK
ncbi:hypothetical protein EV426DRAFT_721711 [Tirmania nivea]|nr:hypothetical protein EV426DRAFT_721711 [Tirmania nivea]